jgi:hypothetical protein
MALGVYFPVQSMPVDKYDEVIRRLEPWAMQSVAFARALPPKEKK